MSVGIHETGHHHLPVAIDFNDFAAIVLQPWILQDLGSAADGDYLPIHAQDCSVFDNPQFLELAASTWAWVAGFRSQRNQLADIHQQQWPVWFGLLHVSP